MHKLVRTKELFESFPAPIAPLFADAEYPWEVLPRLKDFLRHLIASGIEGYTEITEGVLVGENVKIYSTATIEGPAIIGKDTVVRPGAFIRGSFFCGEGCVLGNSSEYKNCILLDKVQTPHYNYVGDSVLGNRAHTGAGTICSNFKADGKGVVVHGDEDYPTGLRKLGGILGDGADVGCGAVINPGTVIGKRTSVYPLTALRGVYPADCIVKRADLIVKRK